MSWTVFRSGSRDGGGGDEGTLSSRMRLRESSSVGSVEQPEDTAHFNTNDLDDAIAKLPAMGITLKGARRNHKKSRSADEALLPDAGAAEGEESIYHPPYEYGSNFSDASTIKANICPLVLRREGPRGGDPLSETQDARMKATALRVERRTLVALRDIYPFYSSFKGSGGQTQRIPDEDPLSNLDWTSENSHLHFRYLHGNQLRFFTGPGGEVTSSSRRRPGVEDDSSASVSKQWECLRLYMQPLVSIGVIVSPPEDEEGGGEGEVTSESLQILFAEMCVAFPALVYFIIRVDESVDILTLLEGDTSGEEVGVTLFTRYHQALGELSSAPAASPSTCYFQARCSMDSTMHRVGASLLVAMEHWISKASPASLALTTPLDLLRSSDLGSSAIDAHDRIAHMKFSHVGRLKKELGDYCLCVRSPDDALVHYAAALDVTKECGDILWHASALEGTCAVDVCAFFRDNEMVEPVASKKLEQLWLSVRQACDQAANLYKSLPTLRASLLLKTAHFGSQLKAWCEPWSYFSYMTQIQIEKYIESVVDSLPNMQLVSNQESVACCLLDVAKIYALCSKKKKVGQYMLLAASSFPDRHKELTLHLTVSAGHLYGLENDFRNHCNWKLLKKWGLLDLYSRNIAELNKSRGQHSTWPKVVQTVQFSIITNALSQGKGLLAAKAAFYFLYLWSHAIHGGEDDLDHKTLDWLLRVIRSAGSNASVHQERKYFLSLLTSVTIVLDAGKFTPSKVVQASRKRQVFLYEPAPTVGEEAGACQEYTMKSGQTVQVGVALKNPFPAELDVLCELLVHKERGEGVTITFASRIQIGAKGKAESVLTFTPTRHGEGPCAARVLGCSFKLGSYNWIQHWGGLPLLVVM